MARSLRLVYPNAVYHVYARGNRKDRIFFEDRDRQVFLEKLEESLERYSMICYAYCLMNNHYHLLIRTPEANISRGIHLLNSAYANWVKAKHSIIGVVFQGRFKTILVDEANYALTLAAYIVLNPVRAALVKGPQDYPWSSYAFQIGLRSPGQMRFDPFFILRMLDPDPPTAAEMFERYVLARVNMESPFKDLFKGCVLGDKNFIETAKARIRDRGRDREIPATAMPDGSGTSTVNSERIERIMSIVTRTVSRRSRATGWDNHRKFSRDITLYILRQHSSLTLKQIGKSFGMDYVAVHQAVARFAKRLENEPMLKQKVLEAMKESALEV